MTFDEVMEFVLKHEGGYVNLSTDPGGATKYGISQRAYPKLDIQSLTPDKAKEIYKFDYWDKIRIGDMPPGVRLMVMDAAVNQGPARAALMVQRVLGVKDDGKIGPQTLTAFKSIDSTHFISQFAALRFIAYTSNPNWIHFGKGWGRRLIDCILISLS